MIKPIFSPNAKNNMAEIIPILLARKCRVLYVVKDNTGNLARAIRAAEVALKDDQPRITGHKQKHWAIDIPNGSRILICRMANAAEYLRYRFCSAIYVQAHKFESPEHNHDEFVQLATEHLAESRKSLQERLVATGALDPGAVLPALITKQAE